MTNIYTHGKLLLSGEYFVLDGALALALPTRLGQRFEIIHSPYEENIISWLSFDHEQNMWLAADLSYPNVKLIDSSDKEMGERLVQILQAIEQLNPSFFNSQEGSIEVNSFLEFDRRWGLGSSSTLIAALAQWADVNPYHLLEATFGGSGYDLACAYAKGPIWYQRFPNKIHSETSVFNPSFKDHLYFIYQGKKKNSREAIQQYRSKKKDKGLIHTISELGKEMESASALYDFQLLIKEHEKIVGDFLHIETIQNQYPDFEGQLKSLGGWGGDFMLAATDLRIDEVKAYFDKKGLDVVLPYKELIL